MAEIFVSDKTFVIPGDVLAKGLDYLPSAGTFKVNDEIRSKFAGQVRIKDKYIGVTPLAGVYIPKPGDGIIAVVKDMQATFWIFDINSPYDALLQLGEATGEFVDTQKTDISRFYDIGEIVYAKVLSVSKSKNVHLTMNDQRAKKLHGGRLIPITPSKVPRLIGKEGSMIEQIKEKTGTQITIGQNGLVWIRGGKESLAAKIILMIEKESHLSGLTDKVAAMLGGV